MLIRPASATDVDGIAAIYAHEVQNGVATFDTTPPPPESWLRKVEDHTAGHHLLVAEEADGGLLGYAYSVDYRARGAYAGTRETSIYLAPDARGRGVGRALYAELIDRLRRDGMHTAIAVIAAPNPASAALHRAVGFELAGRLRQVGFKFGRLIDTEFWQLLL